MTGLLRVVLWGFPASFVQRFGEAWISTTEDVLAAARARGLAAYALAWLRLAWDAGWQLPGAYATAVAEAWVGQPPALAGLSAGEQVWALTLHWGVRPLRATARWLEDHQLFLVVGALGGWVAYHGLAHRAVYPKASLLETMDAAWTLPAWGLLGLAAWLVWGHLKLLRRWRHRGFTVVSPVVFAWVGFHLAIVPFLLLDTGREATVLVQVFVDYPANRETPARPPFSDDVGEWLPAQRQWFRLDGHGEAEVRSERQAAWCAARRAVLGADERRIFGLSDGVNLRVQLWAGLAGEEIARGCFSNEEVLARHTALWRHAGAQQGGRLQRTWEPLAPVSPILDFMMAGHYLTYGYATPTFERYCVQEAQAMAPALAANGRTVDAGALEATCQALDAQVRAHAGFKTPKTLREAWWGTGRTADHREALAHLPVVTRADLPWIRRHLEVREGAWTQARGAP